MTTTLVVLFVIFALTMANTGVRADDDDDEGDCDKKLTVKVSNSQDYDECDTACTKAGLTHDSRFTTFSHILWRQMKCCCTSSAW